MMIDFGDTSYYVAMILKENYVDAKAYKIKISEVETDDYYAKRLEFK